MVGDKTARLHYRLKERRDVPLWLAAAAVGLSVAISGVLGSRKITVPGWLDVTSVPLLYGALYTFFDKFAWRWRIFRTIRSS